MLFIFYMLFYALGFTLSLKIALRILQIEQPLYKILAIGLLQALLAFFIYFFNTPIIIMLILAVTNMTILVWLFFRFNPIVTILIVIKTIIIFFPVETIVLATLIHGMRSSFSQVFVNPSLALTALFLLVAILSGILYLVNKYEISSLANKLYFIETEIENKTRIWVIIALAAENLIIIYFIIYYYILRHATPAQPPSMVSVALLLSLVGIILDTALCRTIENEIDFSLAKEKADNLTALNQTLQYQQHDFKHHLQVISSLTMMNKRDRLAEYLDDVSEELKKLDFVTNTGVEALNGLLHHKITEANKHNLKLKVEIDNPLHNLNLKANQLCRVIGNVLDNAIEHLKDYQPQDKSIYLQIKKEANTYQVIIENQLANPEVLPANLNKILAPGYTNNQGERGLGLAIAREILHSNEGDLRVKKTPENKFRFVIRLPAKEH